MRQSFDYHPTQGTVRRLVERGQEVVLISPLCYVELKTRTGVTAGRLPLVYVVCVNEGDINPWVACNPSSGNYNFTKGSFTRVTSRAFRAKTNSVPRHNVLNLK